MVRIPAPRARIVIWELSWLPVFVKFCALFALVGPGPDFVVFENPFYVGGDPNKIFAELATVAVSADGTDWKTFPCTAMAAADGTPLPPFGSCAGWHPVLLNSTCAALPVDPPT